MLKIKDDIPLEKLKEFGFEHKYSTIYSRQINNLWYAEIYIDDKRIYRVTTGISGCRIKFDDLEEYIQDLIDANLVEEYHKIGIEQQITKLLVEKESRR